MLVSHMTDVHNYSYFLTVVHDYQPLHVRFLVEFELINHMNFYIVLFLNARLKKKLKISSSFISSINHTVTDFLSVDNASDFAVTNS
jgi:hypothetical protein